MINQNIIVEFQRQSKRTAPFQAEPCNKQEFEWILSNYTLGLVGEVLELDAVLSEHKFFNEYSDEKKKELSEEFKKESGDVWNYLVNLLSILGEEFDENKVVDNELLFRYSAGSIVEKVKKGIYHGHGIDKDDLILDLYGLAYEMMDLNRNNLSEILDKNIAKLKLRYPNSFTVEDSIARVDVK